MTNPILIAFGEHLRKLRVQKGLSQEKLAEKAQLHRTYLGGVERGERNPTLMSLIRIAKALNVSLPTLLEFSERQTLTFSPKKGNVEVKGGNQ